MEQKIYQIADRRFYQEELVFGTEVWLRDEVFHGTSVTALSQAQLWAMLQECGMMFMAIVLIEEGQTQADKVKAGLPAVMELRDWFNAHVRPREVMEYVNDFFGWNLGNLWLLVDAKAVRPRETGSPSPSSSLVMVT